MGPPAAVTAAVLTAAVFTGAVFAGAVFAGAVFAGASVIPADRVRQAHPGEVDGLAASL